MQSYQNSQPQIDSSVLRLQFRYSSNIVRKPIMTSAQLMTKHSILRLRTAISEIKLRRVVTSNRFIPEVDGFRFFAIVIVICSHIYGQCGPIPGTGIGASLLRTAFSDGKRGVYLFFTISGFILALPFARHSLEEAPPVKLSKYFRRRITRLEPPYLLSMLLRLPMVFLYKHATRSTLLVHFLASIFYFHGLAFRSASTINPPAWSLEIEIQFYILAPLLSLVFRIQSVLRRRLLLVLSIVIFGILATLVVPQSSHFSYTLINYMQFFLAGFLLCDFYLSGPWHLGSAWTWDLLGTATLVWILYSQSFWYPLLLPFATIIVYSAGFYGRMIRGCFSFAPVSLIGGMCYSLYLTHTTILTAVNPIVKRLTHSTLSSAGQSLAIFTLCFSSIFLVGVTYFIFVERPCMVPDWPRKLVNKLARS
jgi:peptidoglycan/LPS O-acetylase OafA/YrhL